MTIRVRDPLSDLDVQRIAAAVTSAVLNPSVDDAQQAAHADRVGRSWVRWSDVAKKPVPAGKRLD